MISFDEKQISFFLLGSISSFIAYYSIIEIRIMKTQSLLLTLTIICLSAQLKSQRPIFEGSPTIGTETSTNPLLQQLQLQQDQSSRKLLSITRNPIRITIDSSSFNTITTTTTASNLAFVLRAMQVAVNFYSSRIKVYPLSSLVAPGVCVDYTPSVNDQNFGIGASDLHIYVLYITDSAQGYGATGKSCLWYGQGSSLPDLTLQQGRPVMGRIIFNTYNLVDQKTSLTNVLFQSVTSTALHETLHILGFDSTLYDTWLISDEANANFGYNYTNPKVSGTTNANRPTSYFMTTPNVLAWARTFFDCPTLIGMPLQNEDSTDPSVSGSHWQRVAMYDELMTGTAMGSTIKYFSALSFAALKDMGWYTVDDTFNQTSNFGYKKGCSFITQACYGTAFTQFCNASTTSTISSCQTTFYGKAICSSQSGLMADGCGMMGPYTNCIDPDSTDLGYASYTMQAAGTNSFCVSSTLGTVPLSSTLTSRCYPYTCNPANITFKIGTNTITCLNTDGGKSQNVSSMAGQLICPDFTSFCSRSRKTCANWCSQNGYCMGGVCNCLAGYYGSDCSKSYCTAGTYYDPTTSQCVSVCPNKYYQNVYSRSCQRCDISCQQCYGQPTICSGCISTADNPKYYYNITSLCYTTCPDGTYGSGFNCQTCASSAYCGTCSITATNCTSCSFDVVNNKSKYLNQPNSGVCIDACPTNGTYILTDVVNKVCVNTCANNLKEISGTCDFCSNNTFKFVSNNTCIANCPNYYYADTVKHLCAQCDSSCLTCSGAYAENCTACSPTATLRYWLLSMCWSSCPGGYYPNNTDSKCYLCPTELSCGNCTYSGVGAAAVCTSCSYGNYFQSSTSSCSSACNATQFGSKGNNSCLGCDSSCMSCSGPGPSFCTSCNGMLLVQNLTGSYCVSACNPVGYSKSGGNCLACDKTCLTCSGTSNSDCLSCPNSTFLTKKYCLYVCPPTTFPNTTSNQCSSCDGSCTFCFGPTIDNCTGCISKMVLYNFTCTLSCPAGYSLNQWNVCFEPHIAVLAALWLAVAMLII